jgi:quinol monooxygenase YgiN
MTQKVLVSGTAKLYPEAVAKATDAIRAMQEEARKEPGCIVFLWGFAVEDPNLIHIYEVWENDTALSLHLEAEHVKCFKEVVPDIFIEDPKVHKAILSSDFEEI